MTQLTALTVDISAGLLDSSGLAQHLPQLPGLRRLCVRGLLAAASEVDVCLRSLTALTELEVALRPLDTAVGRSFAACAARMPRLRASQLRLHMPASVQTSDRGLQQELGVEAGWVEGLRDLPCWGRYVFGVGNSEDPTEGSLLERVRQELVGRGACVSPGCREVEFGDAENADA